MKSILVLAVVVATALGHSFISVPTTRTNQGQSQTGCRGPTCVGPCDGGTPSSNPIQVSRGAPLDIRWPRNNHPGGFIRFAWAPTDQSNSHQAFDSRVQMIQCHETGRTAGGACAPGSAGDPNGGDPLGASDPSKMCAASFNVPDWLTDGRWTLQWAWFGGGFALGDYYSCVDYQVNGGPTGTIPASFTFKGGDYTNPGAQLCKTFNADRLHACKLEPCDQPNFNGVRNVAPFGTVNVADPPVPPQPTQTKPGAGDKCYATPAAATNLGSPIGSQCGGANQRCADNMCCSQYGFCGATPEYCQQNKGDWRLTPCAGLGGMCYQGKTNLNLDGAVSRTGACGTTVPGNRCPDGQCCSQYGYCGTSNDHCNNNQGDWRLVTCNGNNNIAPRDAIYSNSTTDPEQKPDDFSQAETLALGLLTAAALAL